MKIPFYIPLLFLHMEETENKGDLDHSLFSKGDESISSAEIVVKTTTHKKHCVCYTRYMGGQVMNGNKNYLWNSGFITAPGVSGPRIS